MKRCFAIVLLMMLLLSGMQPVQSEGFKNSNLFLNAVDGIINNQTEDARYEEALLQLKNHISNNEPVDLQMLEKTFDELGFCEMSFMLSFYCKALNAVDSGNYARALSLIGIIDDDADFAAFRLANPWIGTPEAMYEYVDGRRAEEMRDYDAAVTHYSKCLDYRDSQVRKNNILDIQYQWALDAFLNDTADGYQQAYELFTALGDYKESKAYAQKAQMMSTVLRNEYVSIYSALENDDNFSGQPADIEMVKPEVTYTSFGKGYSGPVDAEVGFDDEGKIIYLVVGQSEHFAESDGIGGKCRDISFTGQFIGLSGDVTIDEIDAVSGATITSQAVVNAVNKSYKKCLEADAPTEENSPSESTPAADAAPAVAGEFSSSAKGYGGPVQVTVSFDATGKITALSIGGDKFKETPGIGDKALDSAFEEQFIGKRAPVAKEDIDAISGATITTDAVISAVNKAYGKFLGQ